MITRWWLDACPPTKNSSKYPQRLAHVRFLGYPLLMAADILYVQIRPEQEFM